jgi:hypothetical protein
VKCIFPTTSKAEIFSKSKAKEVGEEIEAKGGHWCDRMWSRHERHVRSVAAVVRGMGC